MPYDDDFYRKYESYLNEQSVRGAHDWSLATLAGHNSFERVIDLGCGRSQEFYKYRQPTHYLGIDLEIESDPNIILIRANYRNLEVDIDLQNAIQDFAPTAFVSLFSSEITKDWKSNQTFYAQLFSMYPTLKYGLVSGLYYASKKDQPTIQASGGLTHQTLEPLENMHNQAFEERRTILYVSSVIFGDEYEVWRLLIKDSETQQ